VSERAQQAIKYRGKEPKLECALCTLPILPGDTYYPASKGSEPAHEWCEFSSSKYGELTRATISPDTARIIANGEADLQGYRKRLNDEKRMVQNPKWEKQEV
jgi:hypothetical protein